MSSFERRKFLKLMSAGAGAAALPLLLAGCGVQDSGSNNNQSNTSPSNPEEKPLESFTIRTGGSQAQAVAVMQHALNIAAQEVKTANISVDIQDMAQNTAILTMRSGDIETISMSWLNLAQSKEQGNEALGIAPIWANATSIVALEKNGWNTVDDVLGKRLGVGNRETASFTDMRAYWARHGIDIEEDFSVTSMTDQAVLVAMLQSGEFDAIAAFEPLSTKVIQNGGKEIINFGLAIQDENDGFLAPSNSWGLRKSFIDEHDPKMLKELFTRANEIARDEDEPYELANEVFQMDDSTLELFRSRWSKLVVVEYTDRGLELAQEAMDREFEEGRIGSEYDVNDLIVS